MSRKKPLIGIASLLVTLLAVAFVAPWQPKHAKAVTETCSGVPTTFNATAPASVTAGQAFTVSGISSTPTTSYGFTVTTSSLSLSVTGATPTTYTQANTSTDPSPTTGAQTYTAYYPNWALTATGAAGSQIIVKLVQASATVSGVGVINCPLTSTLVTVNVTAPATATPSAPQPTTPSKPTTTTPPATTPTPAPTTPAITPTTTTTTKLAAEDPSTQVVSMKVLVIDGQKHPVKGVAVTIDGQLAAKTGADGVAIFAGIRKGSHTVSMALGKQTSSKQVEATKSDTPVATFTVSTRPSTISIICVGVAVLLLIGEIAFAISLYLGKKRNHTTASI